VEAIENERKNFWGILSDYPDATLRRSIEVLQMFVTMLGRLRKCAEMHAGKFGSEGFATLFSMLQRELDDGYFACIKSHLQQLKFRGGVLISAQLGKGSKGTNYVLRKPEQRRENWFERLVEPREPSYSYHLHPRDESGAKALGDLNDRGVNLVANALAQSTDHILSFFSMLRTELAFYVGCLNLHGKLANKGGAISFPVPACPEERRHSFSELYDPCLALTLDGKIVSNDVNADHKELLIITGANQGGKSTFLRGLGLSQLMMQCGMFVSARSFSANMCSGVFTHFKREEDSTMESGKFDEELNRMSDIADQIRPNAMLLFNESFAATNEREGSEIAR
jgi:DNA mismatch repair ATPase MutS